MGLVNRFIKTKAVCDFLVSGIAQHHLASTDQYWYFTGEIWKLSNMILHVRVAF